MSGCQGRTYSVQPVNTVLVVKSLLWRLCEVALHANHEDFCGRCQTLLPYDGLKGEPNLQGSRQSPRYHRLYKGDCELCMLQELTPTTHPYYQPARAAMPETSHLHAISVSESLRPSLARRHTGSYQLFALVVRPEATDGVRHLSEPGAGNSIGVMAVSQAADV